MLGYRSRKHTTTFKLTPRIAPSFPSLLTLTRHIYIPTLPQNTPRTNLSLVPVQSLRIVRTPKRPCTTGRSYKIPSTYPNKIATSKTLFTQFLGYTSPDTQTLFSSLNWLDPITSRSRNRRVGRHHCAPPCPPCLRVEIERPQALLAIILRVYQRSQARKRNYATVPRLLGPSPILRHTSHGA